jgi:autotransporter-associated beta strand protein
MSLIVQLFFIYLSYYLSLFVLSKLFYIFCSRMHIKMIQNSDKNKILLAIITMFTVCPAVDAAEKPLVPLGVGYEFSVELPNVVYPLPVVDYAENNGSSDTSLRYDIRDNAIAAILKGMNHIWTTGLVGWQNHASSQGPDSYADQQILAPGVWRQNIRYVIGVTRYRSDYAAIAAYLDDARNKNYSVVDGFGPLTETYVNVSGVATAVEVPTVEDILQSSEYYTEHDEGLGAGDTAGALGDVVRLVDDFRNKAPASTSASKYIYSTPRPWRMNDWGEVDYLGSSTHTCVESDGTVHSDWIFDNYISSVEVVPGLICSRRHHKSSGIADNEENRRKDGGYPSGHTNAGYLAALAYAYAFPQRFSEMLTRASQLGENRIVAGMHSPVDVIGGRIHALAVTTYALMQNNIRDDAKAAYAQAQAYFGQLAEQNDMTLFQYAHRPVRHRDQLVSDGLVNVEVYDNNRYANHDLNKKIYRARMTYGFRKQWSRSGQAPVVPEGAELLLATRQPYLTSAQRRTVLYTTEVDSGYPILDESNGWGRIDLVTAADGYGAFPGDVTVTMNAEDGGFSQHDWWRNNISGEGLLTKQGSGTLTLTGRNSYTGGTLVKGGTLEAASATAFGQGDLYTQDGTVLVNSRRPLHIRGNFTQDADGHLKIVMGRKLSQMRVSKSVYIAGGTLQLDLSQLHYLPRYGRGARFTLITGGSVTGKFDSVSAGNHRVKLIYTPHQVIAQIQ